MRGLSPGAKRARPYELTMSAGLPQVSPLSVETTTADAPKKSPVVSRGSQPARKVPSAVTPANESGQRVNLPVRMGNSPTFQVRPPSWVTANQVMVELATAWYASVMFQVAPSAPSRCMLPIATAIMFFALVGSTASIGSPAPRVASPNRRYSSDGWADVAGGAF